MSGIRKTKQTSVSVSTPTLTYNKKAKTTQSQQSRSNDNAVTSIQDSSMDVEQSPKPTHSDYHIVTRSSSKLFDTLEMFNNKSIKQRKRLITDNNASKINLVENSSAKVPPPGLSAFKSKADASHRHIISGTGRLAFSGKTGGDSGKIAKEGVTKQVVEEQEEVRLIYRLAGRNGRSADDNMEWSDLNLQGGNQTVVEVSQEVKVVGSAPIVLQGGSLAANFKTMTMSESGSSSSSAATKTANKPNTKPTVGTSSFFNKSNSSSGSNSSSSVFSKFKGSGAAQSYNKPSSANLGVGVGGKAAAMARMAVLGEEWPEEEELPGSTGHMSTSGKEVQKEVQSATQRQQKIKAAKRG